MSGVDKINMALDDIIKKDGKGKRGGFRGRGRGRGTRGAIARGGSTTRGGKLFTGKNTANRSATRGGVRGGARGGNTRGTRGRGRGGNVGGVNRANYNSFNQSPVKRVTGNRANYGRGMANNNTYNNKPFNSRRGSNSNFNRNNNFRETPPRRQNNSFRSAARPGRVAPQRGAQTMLQDQNTQVRQLQLLAQNQQLLQKQLQQLQNIQSRQNELLLHSSSSRSNLGSYNDHLDRDVLMF